MNKSTLSLIFLLTLITMPVVLTACIYNSEAMYTPPPPGYIKYGSGKMPVKPDKFSVNPKDYPEFTVAQSFRPPLIHNCHDDGCPEQPTAEILASDVWRVTHVFDSRYLIESKAYNERECWLLSRHRSRTISGYIYEYPVFVNPSNDCLSNFNFAIYIDSMGKVSGGWELLPSQRLIFSARYMYMSYDPQKNAGWPSRTVFIPVS